MGDDETFSADMADDGPLASKPTDGGKDDAAKKPDETHDAADPAKTTDRANVTPVDQGCGVAEKDKKF